jgi:ATP-dependent helicase/nuclease subunit B
VQIRFLLGPAGSGKTFRCLAEIRDALRASAEGPPLVLLAPKQATFQLERQLLADPKLSGYTRLQILSFERLAEFIVDHLAEASPELLQEEGRVMVLRALLGRHQSGLRIFHTAARLPGFARQLNLLLREFQRHQLSPSQVAALAKKTPNATLSGKLHDVAMLLDSYLDWLRTHRLQDANCLLDVAADVLRRTVSPAGTRLRVAGLWLDGFAEMTPQELDLLAAFLPICDRATLAFCLDAAAPENASWLSGWSVVNQTFLRCQASVAALPQKEMVVEKLNRVPAQSRFAESPALQNLEEKLATDFTNHESRITTSGLRLAVCADPEAEATLAAREILRFVRANGRFRDTAVIVRQLDGYHDVLRRVFLRYGIPFFLDRREPVAHHPLAELTRYALRLALYGWQHDDWFGALKTGLVTADESAVDRLENEALARGWEGNAWFQPLNTPGDSALEQSLNRWLGGILPAFARWNESLAALHRRPTAKELTAALRELWSALDVAKTLEQWDAAVLEQPADRNRQPAIHSTVLEQMNEWLDNVDLAFGDEPLPLAEWLPILEAGVSNLSVGVVPPALDQVLIGAIDRSRNPELKFVLLPGWNETVFPAVPPAGPLLTEAERESLAGQNVRLGPSQRQQIGHERYYAYIACTRARRQILVTRSTQDSKGQPLNPSPFFDQLRQITGVTEENFDRSTDWRESEHACEIAAPVLRAQNATPPEASLIELGELPALAPLVRKWRELESAARTTRLDPGFAEKIYGRELQTSVSGLEDFAACPFKFFAARGLRLQERKEFQFDDRDKGSFQHEVLRKFHDRVRASGRHWRDLTPAEAREWIMRIGRELLPEFNGGKFLAGGAARFAADYLIERLGQLIATLIGWMPQYGFDAERVEVGFGLEPDGLPPWRIDLPGGHALFLRGRIDRVDLCRNGDQTFAVVMDYKSSARALNPLKLHHGLELQLLSYLGVLRNLASPEKFFGVRQLTPAGVFYIPLNGGGGRTAATRADALLGHDDARRAGYQHSGRFLADVLKHFDNRGADRGDQFRFAINKNGEFSARGNEATPAAEFEALREKVEGHLRDYGRRIFDGEADVSPFRAGRQTACDRCDFRAGCRFDSWTQPYRELHPPRKNTAELASAKSKSKTRE